MKKIFYLASIAALALSSCAKDQTTEAQIDAVNGGSKITAAVVADDTRTELVKGENGYEFRWKAGDQLGVYAVNGAMANAAFTLANDSDGKAVGVFTSQSDVLDPTKEYLAVYPREKVELFSSVSKSSQTNLNNPNGPKVSLIDYTGVNVNIPSTQYYRDASFYTMTAPSVSTNFVVDADGAQLSMQPVADYLYVNIMSTEPISNLVLKMYDRQASQFLNIAGTAALQSYNVKGAEVYRHYMNTPAGEDASSTITLKVNEQANNVACHESNTYVFVVPAGILGMGGNIEAWIWVNEDDATKLSDSNNVNSNYANTNVDFIASTYEFSASGSVAKNVQDVVSNAQMNYYLADPTKPATGTNVKSRVDASGNYVANLENMVFWMNPLYDANYDDVPETRESFSYNPNGDVIIDNQWELLEYMVEYEKNTAGFVGKDAFLCADGAFDFSLNTMENLTTENTTKAKYYQDLIDNYLADGFPCITNYTNNFVGNGAVISNIFQPLISKNGIFGDVSSTGSITGIEFANIEADYWQTDVNSDGVKEDNYGVILANKFEGKIADVKITNAHGAAVMGEANVAAFNGIEFSGVSRLEHIFDNLVADNNLDMTETWATVSGVTGEIFHNITPADNASTTATSTDLNVIKIANGDITTYATLTAKVDADKDDNAVAVVINGVSYWTGDTFKATAAAASPGTTYASYKKVQYAEQLAAGDVSAYVLSDMDMNWDNLKVVNPITGELDITNSVAWKTPTAMANLYGNGATVKNIHMLNVMDGSGENITVAPFDITTKADNLKLEDVNIDIITNDTDDTVPGFIGGFVKGTNVVNAITVNGLNINAYRADATQNTQANYGSHYTLVGWLVANSQNLKLTASTVTGVQSNVKGLSALVGRIEISNSAEKSAHIKNSSASNVEFTMAAADAPAAISKFGVFTNGVKYNVYGTAIAMVYNNSNSNATIKFEGVGQPKFLFKNANNSNGLNVVYVGNTIYDTLHNGDEF